MPERHSNRIGDVGRYPSLRDYLAVIRRYRWIVLLTTLLGVAAAVAISELQEPVYEAEASVSFREPSQDVELIGLPTVINQTPETRAAVGAEAASRRDVLRAVKRRLKLPESLEELDDNVGARSEVRTNLVVIQARDSNRARAVRIADAVANEVVRRERSAQRKRFDELITATRRQNRRGLRGGDFLTRVQRRELEKLLVQLRATRDFTAPVELVEAATASADAVSPKPVRNTLIGFIGGLTLGIFLCFLRASLDRRLRGAGELTKDTDAPVLATLRKQALGRKSADLLADDSEKAQVDLDALRILRINLEHLHADRGVRTVLVTSPLPEEGKSTVAVGLATATALTGRQVLLLEGDLRRPVLADRLDLRKTPGLTDYLTSKATSQEALQAVALPGPGGGNGGKAGAAGGGSLLSCMTAGSPPPRHAELLGSPGFADFLGVISRAYDSVVIDSGPLLPAVDTLQLVERVDAVVLCVRANQTTRDELNDALEALRRLTERPIGLVVTGVTRAEDRVYGSYHYAHDR